MISTGKLKIFNFERLRSNFAPFCREYKAQHGFVGIINMRQPNIVIIHPDLVKQVLVRNFSSFADNSFADFTDKHADPIIGRNPFILKGNEWREKRGEITPAFTVSRVSLGLI